MPAVSVIVPSFNHAPFLERRLRSIEAQTYRDFEVLVLDDASTDDSPGLLDRYARTGLRVDYRTSNSGSPFRQWNRGVGLTTAPLVWIAESDDEADPRLLETLVDRLDRSDRCGLAYCQSLCIDADGRIHGTAAQWTADLDPGRWNADYVNSGRDECARLLAVTNTIPNASAVVFRREVFARAGGAPDDMRLAGDWMTWLRMLLVSDITYTAEPLNRHRSHPETVRARLDGQAGWWRESLAVWRCAQAHLDLPDETTTRIVDIVREVIARLLPRAVAHPGLLRDLYALGSDLHPRFGRSLARLLADRARRRLAR